MICLGSVARWPGSGLEVPQVQVGAHFVPKAASVGAAWACYRFASNRLLPGPPPVKAIPVNARTPSPATVGAPRGPSEARPNLRVLLAIVAGMSLLAVLAAPLLDEVEQLSYDLRLRARNALMPQSLRPEILVVGIGENDAAYAAETAAADDAFATRGVYNEFMNRTRAWGTDVVAFDIFFEDERGLDDVLALSMSGSNTVLGYRFKTQRDVVRSPEGDPPGDIAGLLSRAEGSSDPSEISMLATGALLPYSRQLATMLRVERDAQDRPLSPEARSAASTALRWARHATAKVIERWFALRYGIIPPTGGDPWRAEEFQPLSPSLMFAASSLGFANIEKGEENVVRRAPLVYAWGDRIYPSLSLAAALEYYDVPFSEVKVEWGRAVEFTPKRHDTRPVRIPIDARGDYLVNFRGGEEWLNTQTQVTPIVKAESLVDRDREQLKQRFAGAIVFVGELITGGGGTDIEPIPLHAKFPMVGLHANVMDNILRRDFLRTPPPMSGKAISVAMLVLGAALFRRRTVRVTVVVLVGVLALYIGGAMLAFMYGNLVMPLVGPMASVLGWGAMGAYTWNVSERDRRVVREIFGKTVSPRIGEEILRNYNNEALWGSTRTITVLFVDIRGYTTLSESAEPARVLEVLDRFYDTVSESVFRHDGQVNKFLGDAVLALFGALPDEPANHAERAIRAAADIQRALLAIANSQEFSGLGLRLQTGAGINTGPATVGIVGRRETRIEYTAIGDSVNVASRLQGNASEGQIAIGGEAISDVGGVDAPLFKELKITLRHAGSVPVKGRRQPVEVYIAELPTAC